jgi:hypothetical protein
MTAEYIGVRLVRPVVVTVLAVAIVAGAIFTIGQLLLNLHDTDVTEELKRMELWVGVALAVGILAVAALLSSRPAGALGPLDREVAIGSKPMRGEIELGPINPYARYGMVGTTDDLAPGFTLYARNGALAELVDVLKSVEDFGEVSRTLLFARGLHGAADNLWIPIEAVSAVYPESRSAFLAVAGDETIALGWDRPPSSFARTERPKETPLY